MCRISLEKGQILLFELTVVDMIIENRISILNLADDGNLDLLFSLVVITVVGEVFRSQTT